MGGTRIGRFAVQSKFASPLPARASSLSGAVLIAILAACGSIGPVGGGGSSGNVSVAVNASSPGTPINQDLLGVNGPGPSSDVSVMSALGLHFVRTDVRFESSANYDCTSGTWSSTNLDNTVNQIKQQGGVPLVIIDYSPSCLETAPAIPNPLATGCSCYNPPDVGSNQPVWNGLVEQMAYHEITAEGVRYFEVWNEPDGAFWSAGESAYNQLYSDSATAVETAASKAGVSVNVGGPALANLLGTMDTLFLDPFLSFVSSHNLPLDFLSWHTYANDPVPSIGSTSIANPALTTSTYTDEANSVESALGSYPSLHPELIIDEWNVNGLTDARMGQTYGAAFAASLLSRAQGSKIGAMSFYNSVDSNFGLVNPDLSTRPVYSTFLFWHQMAADQVPVSVGNDSDGLVGAVAAASPGGRITVMVFNFKAYDLLGNYGTSDPTPYDHSVNLTVNGLGSSSYSYTRAAIDATHNGTEVASGTLSSSGNSLTFTVPGEGVAFVTLSPQ